MKILERTLVAVGLLGLGCRFPWEPKFGIVTGYVRYPDKTPVYRALVSIADEGSTFTDMLGRYALELRRPEDTVTVLARDGYTPGRTYGETSSGVARVVVRGSVVVQNVVLDRADPI